MKDIDGLVQERLNTSALAMELRLSCTNLSFIEAVFYEPASLLSMPIAPQKDSYSYYKQVSR